MNNGRAFRLGFAALVLFTSLAGDFWRNLLSWYGFGAIVLMVFAGSIVVLVRAGLDWKRLPYPLLVFLVLATVSIAWSFYPGSSVLGAAMQWVTTIAALSVAISLNWQELLRVLGWVFRLILALSFLFEFVVAAFIRHPVFPVWVTPDNPDHVAKLLYWSRDLLFSTGKIQGIVGNSSLLAMIALLALIVFFVQLASRQVGRGWGWIWLGVALVTLAITRSATINLALAIVVIVAVMALLVRRATTTRGRGFTYGGIVAAIVVVGAGGLTFQAQILGLLGKSTELTGRADIWSAVIDLAQQRPAFGWGWVSYWTPWVEPFKSFLHKGGVQVMHAHDAWLDVWLQLGILGLIVFGLLVLATLLRSWIMATNPVITMPGDRGTFSWLGLLPLLLLVAELVQSIAESRLLVEGGWVLLVVLAVKTKLEPHPAIAERRP